MDAPMGEAVVCDAVKIPLKMHIGGPDTPLVSVGQSVSRVSSLPSPTEWGQYPRLHRRHRHPSDRRVHRDKEVKLWVPLV